MSRLLQPVFVLSLLSLAACTVGPDFQRPEGPRVEAWASPQKAAPSQVVTSPWTSVGGMYSRIRSCRP